MKFGWAINAEIYCETPWKFKWPIYNKRNDLLFQRDYVFAWTQVASQTVQLFQKLGLKMFNHLTLTTWLPLKKWFGPQHSENDELKANITNWYIKLTPWLLRFPLPFFFYLTSLRFRNGLNWKYKCTNIYLKNWKNVLIILVQFSGNGPK